MDTTTAISNLTFLYEHPELDGIGIAPDGVTLINGMSSPEKQQILLNVINQTFDLAEKHESKGRSPLYVKIRTPDNKLDCYTAGYVLNKLVSKSPVLKERKLFKKVETHRIFSIKCADGVIEVDGDALSQENTFFASLFGSFFLESKELKATFSNYAIGTFQALVNFLLLEELPQADENILELLDFATRLDIKMLQDHLIRLLISTDILDDEGWRSLLQGNTPLFCSILDVMSDERALNVFIPPNKHEDQGAISATASELSFNQLTPQVIKDLFMHLIRSKPYVMVRLLPMVHQTIKKNKDLQIFLIELINNKKIDSSYLWKYDDLINLFEPDQFQQITILDLKLTKLENSKISLLISLFPDLQKLILPMTVSGEFLNCLKDIKKLQHLDISNCKDLEPNCLNNLQHTPKLLHLNISFCTQLERNCLNNLQYVRELQYLYIVICEQLEPNCLINLQHTPKLLQLDIIFCTQLEPNCLSNLKYVNKLKHLNASMCTNLEPNCLINLQHTPTLKHLFIINCRQLKLEQLPSELRLETCQLDT